MPPSGQSFGKYLLEDRIAAGGMAEIYRAKYRAAAGITKPVVIKKILPHYAGNKSFIKMFMDEAKIVVGLSHGNIAQVFDFGEIEGEYFLAMELVHGQALSRFIRRAKEKHIPVVPTPFAVHIAMEMCKGLHYAHTRLDDNTGKPLGIVHRDVSPQNVILAYDGQVKLVDFGIAKARTAGRSETEAGAIKGKYVYFSPEQARGKDLDARTDVFATGIVLYEMLCGRLPFEGKMMDVLQKVVRCEFPRPRAINPDITPALERILLTAMAADRNDRYPSAQAFQEALAGYLYANAPTFSGAALAHMLAYLYEPELVADGRPVQLPRDFLEQIPLWQKQLPGDVDSGGSDRPTAAGKSSSKSARSKPKIEVATRAASEVKPNPAGRSASRSGSKPVPASPSPDASYHSTAAFVGKSRWLLFAAPLVAAGLAAGIVVAVGQFGTFSVKLTSEPSGASVSVDGSPPTQVTPVLISNLSANQKHTLEVTAPGMQRWVTTIEPVRGTTLPVHAVLTPERPPADLTADPGPAADPRPQAPPDQGPEEPVVTEQETARVAQVSYGARYPIASVELDPRHHALLIPPTKAARVRLDPKKTYTIWAEGEMSLGGYVDVLGIAQVFYFVEGTDGLPASETFGELGGGKRVSRTIRNATALYGFVFDERPFDNSGAAKIRIQQKGARDTTTLLVDAKLNAIFPDEKQRFTLEGLDGENRYALRLKSGEDPARSRNGRTGKLDRVVVLQNSGKLFMLGESTDRYAEVVDVSKPLKVVGADYAYFVVLDDALEDNGGTFSVEIEPVAGSGGALGRGIKGLLGGQTSP